ncbi:hypothetical protein GCM10010280_45600 [Streptomyces pilosus]|uniref:Uncharacterized protein n=1 Tax=Streptomyces pilosus TaxID=28893 RepID=A0A918F084_9ACTN|nr:hypothetical protein GCM10010280_45600 [Streptomyces pilosus]
MRSGRETVEVQATAGAVRAPKPFTRYDENADARNHGVVPGVRVPSSRSLPHTHARAGRIGAGRA